MFLGVTQLTAAKGGQFEQPTRKWVVYLLPHSHVDIGYTHVQPEVEQKQWQNIDKALELCGKTADYPPEARFKWNAEVLWAVDSYLRQAPPEKQQQLVDAIRAGQVELDALYGNELTGLCRPEELLRLMQCGIADRQALRREDRLGDDQRRAGLHLGHRARHGPGRREVFLDRANFGDRIGRTMTAWEDKPFYWLGPDGRQKVLVLGSVQGLRAGASGVGFKLDQQLPERLAQLETEGISLRHRAIAVERRRRQRPARRRRCPTW